MQNGGHMISLWGIDFDEDKKVVTRVYLSDSDDALGYSAKMQKGLFVADCTWAEDVKGPNGQPYPTLIMDTESPGLRTTPSSPPLSPSPATTIS